MLDRIRRKHPGSSIAHIAFYALCRDIATLILKLGFGLRLHHRERLPADGPVLIVANHQSFLDPPAIGGLVRSRHLDFIARAGLFKFGPFGWLINALNSVPVAEQGGDTAAMKETLRRLKMNRAVLIFPEGSRSPDGAVKPFKRGVAVLLKRAKCPVLPVAIEGAYDAWPRTGKPRPFRCPVEVTYGHPISPEELMADGPDAAVERLYHEVETLRVELHARIRARTKGRYPTSPAARTDEEPAVSPPTDPVH